MSKFDEEPKDSLSTSKSLSSLSADSTESDTERRFMKLFRTKSGVEKLFELQKEYGIDNLSRDRSGSSFDKNDPMELEARSTIFKKPRTGLSKNFAALYMIASFCGNGVTYLPYAMKLSGFVGYMMFLLVGMNSLYCGLLIGRCRMIVQEQWPEYKDNLPSPYPKIGLKAVGKWMEYVVIIVMNMAIFDWSTVLISNMASMLDESTPEQLKFCITLLVAGAVLLPFSMLGSLKDLWLIVLSNTFIMALFSFLLITAIFIDKDTYGQADYSLHHQGQEVASAFGMITFIVSSSGTYPIIHDEMINRNLYSQSVVESHIIVGIMYAPLPLIGYAAYGINVNPNILQNLYGNHKMHALATFLKFLFVLKMMATFLVSLNPLFKNLESLLQVPPKFGFRRCLFRTSVIVLITLLGFLVQQNILILEVVGAALLNILAFQFPVIFYICLVLRKGSNTRSRTISKKEWCFLIEVLLVSSFGGIAALVQNGIGMAELDWHFRKNCYTYFHTASNRSCIFC
ncbi:uncharacterized protein [Parasteatoda tepidariorum]|uniref:uncharacterized protein n=1 Tax=Parasteatoda tepidariorum TaxID=114398 RepID=UPI0039BD0639